MAGRLVALLDDEIDRLFIRAAGDFEFAEIGDGTGRNRLGNNRDTPQALPQVEIHQGAQETGLGFHLLTLLLLERRTVDVLQENIGVADTRIGVFRIEFAVMYVRGIPRSGVDETHDVGPRRLALQLVRRRRHQSAVGPVVLEAVIAAVPVIGEFVDRTGIVDFPEELFRTHLRGENAVHRNIAAKRFFQKILTRETQRHEPGRQ